MGKDAKGHGSNGRGGGKAAMTPEARARQAQHIRDYYAAKAAKALSGEQHTAQIADQHGIGMSHIKGLTASEASIPF